MEIKGEKLEGVQKERCAWKLVVMHASCSSSRVLKVLSFIGSPSQSSKSGGNDSRKRMNKMEVRKGSRQGSL